MSVVAFCGGRFMRVEEAAKRVAERLGYPLLTDQELAAGAAGYGQLSEGKLLAAMYESPGGLRGLTKLRPKALPQLNQAMASLLAQKDMVFLGLGSNLIPQSVTHTLKVGFQASSDYRLKQAAKEEGLDARRARELIKNSDWAIRSWREFLLPPAARKYPESDISLPVEKKEMSAIVELISDSSQSAPLAPTAASLAAVEDMALMSRVQAALAKQGFFHPEFKILNIRGKITVEINRKSLRLAKLEKSLIKAANEVMGAKKVETKVGPGYHQSDVYRKSEFVLPSKVLLVDDEREYVETLSERLRIRDVGASVVYDGDQALEAITREKPEVVVLDLRMPGVDGMEVLQKIKVNHPEIKVIILTGHGSPQDRARCLELGAFAFLQKPVDLEELSEVMRQAVNQTTA